MRDTRRLRFQGSGGTLVGILERPVESVRFVALLTHCFTCTKDLKSIVRLSRELVRHGIAAFRYDLTGLGESDGDFSRSTFANDVADLHAALAFLADEIEPVRLLIGHSLGGAASLAAAATRSGRRGAERLAGVATLAAPSETPHLADILVRLDPSLASAPRGNVSIGGQRFEIDRAKLEGLRSYDLPGTIEGLDLPTLLFHSLTDETVGVRHAEQLRSRLGANCSTMLLPDADHLFVRDPRDVPFLADTISLWAARQGIG